MLISSDRNRIAAPLRHRDGNNLVVEDPGIDRFFGAQLALQREPILVLSGNVEAGSNIFGSLGHRVDTVLGLEFSVDKPPAQRGVENLGIAAESGRLLTHDKRCPRHRLDAARDSELQPAGLNCIGNIADRVHARPAKAIDRRGRYGNR